jgi:hypothetical protein
MATATIQVAYEAETSSLKATVNEINQINDKVVQGATDSAKKVKTQFDAIGKSFEAAFSSGQVKKSLDNQTKAIDGLTNSGKSLTGQLRGLKAELSNLEIAGQDGTAAFNDLLIAAAKLEDQIGDTRAKVKILASDTFKFDAAVGATQALASGFELAQGAAALFGSESEDLQKAIVKITAATAVANGVQQLATLIKEESAVKTAVLTAATAAYNVVVGTSTGALKLFRLALAGTGIGVLVLAIGELISYFNELQKESAKTQTVFERFKDTFANAKIAIEGYRDAIINAQERIDVALGRTSNLQSSVNKQRRDEAKQLGKDLAPLILAQEKLRDEYQREVAVSKDANASFEERIKANNRAEQKLKELLIVEEQVNNTRTAGRAAIDLNTKAIIEEEKAVVRSKQVKRDAIVETIKLETIAFKGSVSRKEEEIKLNLQVSTSLRDNLNADNALRVAQLELEKSLNGESLENTIATINAKAKEEADALGLTATDSVKRQKIFTDAEKSITEATNAEFEKKQDLINKFVQQTTQAFAALNELSKVANEIRLQEIQDVSDKELQAINQSTLLERDKVQSRIALEKKKAAQIAEINRRQAVQDKALAIFNIGLSTSQAIMQFLVKPGGAAGIALSVLAGITGAAEIAAVIAKPIPKFEKGGLIGGKFHSQGGTLIEAEQGEYMVNRRQSAKHRRELDAMNTSTEAFRKMIDEKYVRPALMSYSAGRRGKEGVVVNASLNSKSMEKKLDTINKSLKNRNVIVNINQQDSRYQWQ